MTLIVQKYGGTSVGSIEKIKSIAKKIKNSRDAGMDIVVVVSAMGGDTNRLIELAKQIQPESYGREYDALVSTGEQVSMALLTLALNSIDCPAVSYTGWQIGILTDSRHTRARILKLEAKSIQKNLALGKVVVVAGFQGVNAEQEITTLGRGGSDTTAVALAAKLKATECQIYTDVDGVFTTDPRVVPEARHLEKVTFEEMLELASLGAKVLQIRAVEFAGKHNVPIRVLNSAQEGKGTFITFEEGNTMEHPLVSGIAFNKDEAKLTVKGVPDIPGVASQIIGAVGCEGIEVDTIVQSSTNGTTDFTFTVHRRDYPKAQSILHNIAGELKATSYHGDNKIAKVSIVGVGMRSHAKVAMTMFKALAEQNINIQVISTSEIKVSVIIDEKYLELAVRTLHSAFDLHLPVEERRMGT